jgi:hypothetical protein
MWHPGDQPRRLGASLGACRQMRVRLTMARRPMQTEAMGAKVQVPAANKAANADVTEMWRARKTVVCVIVLGVLHVSVFRDCPGVGMKRKLSSAGWSDCCLSDKRFALLPLTFVCPARPFVFQ